MSESIQPKPDIVEIEDELVANVCEAMEDLPIIARLEFARNVVCLRGGDRDIVPADRPQDAALMMAADVLWSVIEVLKERPDMVDLRRRQRSPQPQ